MTNPIERDHRLIERALRGEVTGDPAIDALGRWRASVLAQDTLPGGAPIFEDLSDYHRAVYDPAVVESVTTMLPTVPARVEYAGHTDVPAPAPVLSAADHRAIAAEVLAQLADLLAPRRSET